MTVSIEAAREAQNKLRLELAEKIVAFEQETGMRVDTVWLSRDEMRDLAGKVHTYRLSVKVEVRL